VRRFWNSRSLRLRLLIRPRFALKIGARLCTCRLLALGRYATGLFDATHGVRGNSLAMAAWLHDEVDRVWRSERLEEMRYFRETT